ncbi:MAG: hypothetical protein JO056_11620 [Alphaproteobacteria bacterium]|nr:hypothetical protein [Alphaproteobacteria bacterium]
MSRYLRLAAVHVALFAMMAHALVPSGWMPNGNIGSGGAAIIPCDGIHHHGMDMGGPAKPKPKQDNSHRHDVCPFAAAPHLGQPASLPGLIPRTLALAGVQLFTNLPRVTVNARVSPQSARAPPQLA